MLDAKARSELRHVTRWFNTVIHQKEVAEVLNTALGLELSDKRAKIAMELFLRDILSWCWPGTASCLVSRYLEI